MRWATVLVMVVYVLIMVGIIVGTIFLALSIQNNKKRSQTAANGYRRYVAMRYLFNTVTYQFTMQVMDKVGGLTTLKFVSDPAVQIALPVVTPAVVAGTLLEFPRLSGEIMTSVVGSGVNAVTKNYKVLTVVGGTASPLITVHESSMDNLADGMVQMIGVTLEDVKYNDACTGTTEVPCPTPPAAPAGTTLTQNTLYTLASDSTTGKVSLSIKGRYLSQTLTSYSAVTDADVGCGLSLVKPTDSTIPKEHELWLPGGSVATKLPKQNTQYFMKVGPGTTANMIGQGIYTTVPAWAAPAAGTTGFYFINASPSVEL